MDTISEPEFKKLLDDIYEDRQTFQTLLPGFSQRDAILWMLLGSLISLLSVPPERQPKLDDYVGDDPFAAAIKELIHQYGSPVFDSDVYVAELSERLRADT
jgi:hypothetical protein